MAWWSNDVFLSHMLNIAISMLSKVDFLLVVISYEQGWNYQLVINGIIFYFSFIEYQFVS